MTLVSKYGLKRFHRPVLLIHLINIANSHGTEPYHGVMLMIGQADTKNDDINPLSTKHDYSRF